MSVYRVIGQHRYREHDPGATFEALLEPDAEERALRHGVLELVERSDPGLRPGSFVPGWRAAREREGRQ